MTLGRSAFRQACGALALLLMLGVSATRAEVPPAKAPGVPFGTGTQPVVIYDAAGNVVNTFGGGGGSGGAISGQNKSGSLQAVGVDARGSFIAPNAGAANRQITKCSVAATSATLTCTINNGSAVSSPAGICPAVADAVVTEVRSSAALIGLGLSGQALTTATDGTGAGTPDMVLPSANTLYTMPVSATNAITAYNPGASAAITVCIQTLRQ